MPKEEVENFVFQTQITQPTFPFNHTFYSNEESLPQDLIPTASEESVLLYS